MGYEKRRRHLLDIKEGREDLLMPEAIALFLRSRKLKNAAESTVYGYRLGLNIFSEFLEEFGVERLFDVITEDIEVFIENRIDVGNKPVTINKYIRELRAFFNHLHRMGYLESNPIEPIERMAEHKTIVKTLSDDQIVKLIAVPDRNTFVGFRNYTFILLLLDTGIRLSEALNIMISDIDWRERLIKVSGKGRKERFIPLGEVMAVRLQDYLKKRNTFDDDTLFLNKEGMPVKRRTMQDVMRKYEVAAGIKGVRVSCHSLRHTFAKNYILNGGDPFSLQKILGHSTMEMVRIYIDLFKPDISRQHDRYSPLNNLLK